MCYDILRETGTLPAGRYKVFLELKEDNTLIFSKTFTYQIDSSLSPTSPLRKELNQTLLPENKAAILDIDPGNKVKAVNNLAANTAKAVDRAAGKIGRLFKSRGLTPIIEKRGDKDYINLWYEGWFVGPLRDRAFPIAICTGKKAAGCPHRPGCFPGHQRAGKLPIGFLAGKGADKAEEGRSGA